MSGKTRVMAMTDADRAQSAFKRKTNARLIAAVPEMLEALKAALDTIQTISRCPDTDMEQEAIEMVRAAIAKAEDST